MIFLAAVSELINVRVGAEGWAASRRLDRHRQSEETARNTVKLIYMCVHVCVYLSAQCSAVIKQRAGSMFPRLTFLLTTVSRETGKKSNHDLKHISSSNIFS